MIYMCDNSCIHAHACVYYVFISHTHTQNKFATPQLLFFFLVIKYSVVSVDDDTDDDGKKIRSKQIKKDTKINHRSITSLIVTPLNISICAYACYFAFFFFVKLIVV